MVRSSSCCSLLMASGCFLSTELIDGDLFRDSAKTAKPRAGRPVALSLSQSMQTREIPNWGNEVELKFQADRRSFVSLSKKITANENVSDGLDVYIPPSSEVNQSDRKITYVDLEFLKTKNLSDKKGWSDCEYVSIDSLKTKALANTKKEVENEREKCQLSLYSNGVLDEKQHSLKTFESGATASRSMISDNVDRVDSSVKLRKIADVFDHFNRKTKFANRLNALFSILKNLSSLRDRFEK